MTNQQEIDNIPQQLLNYPHWVCYCLEDHKKPKLDKVPYDPKTGKRARANDPKTWGTYEQAVKVAKNSKYSGIGFFFDKDDPFCGIDLDSCVQNGSILPWAQKIIDQLNSYTEFSPSESGVHIIVEAVKSSQSCRKGHIEMYDSGRFFTVTGKRLDNISMNIEKRQKELNKLHAEIFGNHSSKPTSKPKNEPMTNLSISDAELINKAMSANNGAKFKALWNGDTSGHSNDDSAADLALCEMLAFWTNKDHDRIDSLFRQSGLMRNKWDRKTGEQTYGDMTISKAMERVSNTYTGKKEKPLSKDHPKQSNKKKSSNPSDEGLIDELNKKHFVIMLGGKCAIGNEVYDYEFDRPDVTFSAPTDFKNFLSNVFTSDGIKLGKAWFEHPRRRQYNGITFSPDKKDIPGIYNLYRGLAVEPKEGDCSLYLEHVKNIIAQGNEEYYNYIIAWQANLIQKPKERPGTSIVVRGKQGTGKGAFISGFGSLFGPHFIHVSNPKHLIGNFNSHLKSALVVYADESFWAGDKSAEGVLKAMITEERFMIEPKGKDAFQIRNYIRLMISSNHDWVIPAGLEERRFFVLDASNEHMQDHEYFKKIEDQMNNGGREALLYYLQHYDLSNVNLRTFPMTLALYEMKLHSMKPIQRFWFIKLKAGSQLNDSDHWTDKPIPVDQFQKEFLDYAGKIGKKYKGDEIEIGTELKKLIPKIERIRVRGTNSVRYYAYKFPPLEECREVWEKMVNVKFTWPEEGAALTTPEHGFIDDDEVKF